jgi:aspartate kinase|tara:strand:+ start:4096 stop:5310 length:1215 start_codon:yes stop_codon:yes gene_type:complete
MKIKVLKFGGTSVGSVEAIKRSANIICDWSKKSKVIVVLSAMSGETDRLINLTKSFSKSPNPVDFDNAISTGENLSCALMSIYLNNQKTKSKSLHSWQIPIMTSSEHMKSRILSINKKFLLNELENLDVLVVPGFQGINERREITTLGRGGSDTSAVAVAAAMDAECIIYTDVEGVFTTDPNIVPNAKKINKISYEEMLELASQGAKVLQTRSVELAMRKNTKLSVRSSLKPKKIGTIITDEKSVLEKNTVSGIAYTKDEAKITLSRVLDKPGVSSKIFGPLAKGNINVDMILQNISQDGKFANLSFTLPRADLEKALKILKKEKSKIGYKKIISSNNISKISVVGVGMRSHAGVAQTLFDTLGKNKINIQVITTSEIKISILIDEEHTDLAVQKLHQAFKLHK